MAKLPTIKLRHKKTGRIAKVDQTDYSRDIAAWHEWEILTLQRGDATDKEVREAAAASDLEKQRREDPIREAWSGDKQRARDEQRVSTGGVVIKPPTNKPVGRPANYRAPRLG